MIRMKTIIKLKIVRLILMAMSIPILCSVIYIKTTYTQTLFMFIGWLLFMLLWFYIIIFCEYVESHFKEYDIK